MREDNPYAKVVTIDASSLLDHYNANPAFSHLRSYVDVGSAATMATVEDINNTFDGIRDFLELESIETDMQGDITIDQDVELADAECKLTQFSAELVNEVERQSQKRVIAMLGATAGGQVLAIVE